MPVDRRGVAGMGRPGGADDHSVDPLKIGSERKRMGQKAARPDGEDFPSLRSHAHFCTCCVRSRCFLVLFLPQGNKHADFRQDPHGKDHHP